MPNLFYAVVVLFHVGLGVLFSVGGLRLLPVAMRQPPIVKLGALVLVVGAVLGLVLIYTGASRPYTKLLLSHGAIGALGVALFAGWWISRRSRSQPSVWVPALGMIAVAAVVTVGAKYSRDSWSKHFVIRNPGVAPLSMNNEGDGASGLFFPSSAQTRHRGHIPSDYFT